jgi:hypothetical protein
MDDDLDVMSREELLVVAKRLREAIRDHRDSELHDLCWYHPEMWGLLPDTKEVKPRVPTREQFLAGCQIFRDSLDRDIDSSGHEDIGFTG